MARCNCAMNIEKDCQIIPDQIWCEISGDEHMGPSKTFYIADLKIYTCALCGDKFMENDNIKRLYHLDSNNYRQDHGTKRWIVQDVKDILEKRNVG